MRDRHLLTRNWIAAIAAAIQSCSIKLFHLHRELGDQQRLQEMLSADRLFAERYPALTQLLASDPARRPTVLRD